MTGASEIPSVFLIMPFDEEFSDVYTHFIKPVLQQAGFEVVRADDIQSQQRILKDIVEGICNSDLIVADLTGANPNVFYELGLAHALRKRVILLTQSIDEIPFDLQGYRLVEYSTHFVQIEKAKKQLRELAEGASQGQIPFGSPVTDFIPSLTEALRPIVSVPQNGLDERDERGFIDHLIDINDFYENLGQIMSGVTLDLEDMTRSLETATAELTEIGASKSDSSPAAVRNVCRRLAGRIETFNSQLQQANVVYTSNARDTENSLEFVVAFSMEHNEATTPEIETQLSSLRQLQSQALGARDSLLDFADQMDQLPRLERRLNREVTRGSQEVRTMARNIDRTIASIDRALHGHD